MVKVDAAGSTLQVDVANSMVEMDGRTAFVHGAERNVVIFACERDGVMTAVLMMHMHKREMQAQYHIKFTFQGVVNGEIRVDGNSYNALLGGLATAAALRKPYSGSEIMVRVLSGMYKLSLAQPSYLEPITTGGVRYRLQDGSTLVTNVATGGLAFFAGTGVARVYEARDTSAVEQIQGAFGAPYAPAAEEVGGDSAAEVCSLDPRTGVYTCK